MKKDCIAGAVIVPLIGAVAIKWLKSLFSKSESKKDSITVDESSKIEILSRKRAKRGPIEGIEILRAYINETVNVTRQISKILNTTESSCPILRTSRIPFLPGIPYNELSRWKDEEIFLTLRYQKKSEESVVRIPNGLDFDLNSL